MRTPAKLGLTELIAAVLLASAIGTASARNLSVNEQSINARWRSLEFAGTVTVRCPITLEGSFHSRTTPKVARLLIGAVTSVFIKRESCTGADLTAQALPWHITYESFAGALPNITSVRLLLQRFLFAIIVELFGIRRTCRYGTATDNMSYDLGLNAERLGTWLVPVRERNIAHLLEGTRVFPECPPEWRMAGAGEDGLVRTNGGGFLKITLI